VLAGYHEVIYTEDTKKVMQVASEDLERVMWRVSSTLFSHFRFDTDLSPMNELNKIGLITQEQASKYKKMTALEKLMEELTATSMV
jgi:hypothetical protein